MEGSAVPHHKFGFPSRLQLIAAWFDRAWFRWVSRYLTGVFAAFGSQVPQLPCSKWVGEPDQAFGYWSLVYVGPE